MGASYIELEAWLVYAQLKQVFQINTYLTQPLKFICILQQAQVVNDHQQKLLVLLLSVKEVSIQVLLLE